MRLLLLLLFSLLLVLSKLLHCSSTQRLSVAIVAKAKAQVMSLWGKNWVHRDTEVSKLLAALRRTMKALTTTTTTMITIPIAAFIQKVAASFNECLQHVLYVECCDVQHATLDVSPSQSCTINDVPSLHFRTYRCSSRQLCKFFTEHFSWRLLPCCSPSPA